MPKPIVIRHRQSDNPHRSKVRTMLLPLSSSSSCLQLQLWPTLRTHTQEANNKIANKNKIVDGEGDAKDGFHDGTRGRADDDHHADDIALAWAPLDAYLSVHRAFLCLPLCLPPCACLILVVESGLGGW
ncbi:hypothetical protein PLICRDRAFT_162967 [Plicaturopsis crispa FD-325 SS-3]|nr:hypothetical protein PLICRDRAFT_162967 [Plicaturopsis crispa FD-325 SS-3]